MKILISTFLTLSALTSYSAATDLKPLDSKSMIYGYCYAGSRKDDMAPGGYGQSGNMPNKITDKTPGIEGQIALVALPAELVPFKGQYLGFRLQLINRTAIEFKFEASDSRLNIICEARDQNGEWKPIEVLPHSFCGNSYHSVYLPPKHYWEFHAPVYTGKFKTKLRYTMQGGESLYSNEFDGSINLDQFKKPETAQ